MAKLLHIAVGSTMSRPGQVAENLALIADFARRAAEDGADVLLTPEMSATGYGPYPAVLEAAEPAGDGPIYQELAGLAKVTGVVLCAGFVEAAGDKRHLAHYVVFPDGHFVVQRKHRVTPAERPLDAPFPLISEPDAPENIGQPATLDFHYFEIKGVRCAVTICADSGITDIDRILAENGVELQLLPAGAGGRREDRVTTEDLKTDAGRELYYNILAMTFLPGRSAVTSLRYGRVLAAVNQCGYDGGHFYHVGHGTITTAMGEIPALIHGLPNLDRQRPMYCHAEVDVEDRLWSPRESVAGGAACV
jgi:predicted amidohydrolase